MSGFDHFVILALKGLIQASKYAAMVTPSTLTVEKGGFNISVSFLWSKKYLLQILLQTHDDLEMSRKYNRHACGYFL